MSTENRAPLRVGVIGLGLMGRRMLGSFAAHEGFEAALGYDHDAAARERARSEFGLATCASVDELFAAPELELIYVATPPASHVELAQRVLESGRALFLEKPLAVDVASAEQLVRAVEEPGARAALNFPLATLPGLQRIERELGDGSAGAILRAEITLHFSHWPRTWHTAGPWLAGEREGGFLREVFSHFAYLTQRVLAPLRIVQASVARAAGAGETRVVADLMAGDTPVSLVGGAGGAAPDFNSWTLFCAERSYRVEDWSIVSTSSGESWELLAAEPGESRAAETQLDELAKLLRGEDSCLPSLREGLDVMRVVEGLLA